MNAKEKERLIREQQNYLDFVCAEQPYRRVTVADRANARAELARLRNERDDLIRWIVHEAMPILVELDQLKSMYSLDQESICENIGGNMSDPLDCDEIENGDIIKAHALLHDIYTKTSTRAGA